MDGRIAGRGTVDMGDDAEFAAAYHAVATQVCKDLQMLTDVLLARDRSGRGPGNAEVGVACIDLADRLRFHTRHVMDSLAVRPVGEKGEGKIIDFVAFKTRRAAQQLGVDGV